MILQCRNGATMDFLVLLGMVDSIDRFDVLGMDFLVERNGLLVDGFLALDRFAVLGMDRLVVQLDRLLVEFDKSLELDGFLDMLDRLLVQLDRLLVEFDGFDALD